MSPLTFLELWWATDMMEKDGTAHAMILTGAPDPDNPDPAKEAFSSGGYFSMGFLSRVSEEVKQQIDFTDIAQKRLTLKMWSFDKPVIAAINGLAIGAGFTLPLGYADLIYLSEHAWIRMPFVRLGLIPEFASAYLLPRVIGFQKTKELFYFGRDVSAREALDLGLVNKVLPHEELLPYAREAALKLIPPGGPALSVRATKRAMHKPYIDAVARSLDMENEGLNLGVTTEDFAEALAARKEKREPVYKGR